MSNGQKLFIGNLSWKVRSEDLRAAFEKYGTLSEATVVEDRENGRSRGFGFVTFNDKEAAINAQKEMNEVDLNGRNIRVNLAEQRERSSQPRTFNRESSDMNNSERSYSGRY